MEARDTGRKILGEFFGSDYMAVRDRSENEFNSLLQGFAEEVVFGRVWSRGALDRKTRGMITIAMLTALNRPVQLRGYLGGVLNEGCTVEELREVLFHAVPYCGVPAAADAFRIAEEVLRERKLIE